MEKNKIKVLYIFANERKKMEEEWKKGLMPDTYFIGYNYMSEFGIKAEYIENKFINYLRNKNYNFANLLLLLKIKKYDIVFTGTALPLIFLVKVIFRFKKPIIVFYNTFLTNLLKRNKRGLKKWLVLKIIKAMDVIVCPSMSQVDFLEKQGFSRDKLHYILTGVDVDFISNYQVPEVKEKFILSVGKDNGRDYKTLIEAVKNLDINVKIVALPRNFKGINKDSLPKNIEIEHLPFIKLLEYYKNALIIIVPTKSEKNLDASDCSGHYAILDAMAAGKAIIASKRDTIYDLLEDNKEAILVEAENALELKRAIEKLIADKNLAENLGKNALEKVKNKFTTKQMAENLANIFKNILYLNKDQ
ncbi:MAG: glycosyltransferase family 4 protein [Patescibacteria group bacterium]